MEKKITGKDRKDKVEITFDLPTNTYEGIKDYAISKGYTVNEYILYLIRCDLRDDVNKQTR